MLSPLPGYPTKFGQKVAQVVNWTPGEAYDTGGLAITAAALGIGGLDVVVGGVSVSGTYTAVGRPVTADGAGQTYKLMVFVVATGAQAANDLDISEEEFRLFILGV